MPRLEATPSIQGGKAQDYADTLSRSDAELADADPPLRGFPALRSGYVVGLEGRALFQRPRALPGRYTGKSWQCGSGPWSERCLSRFSHSDDGCLSTYDRRGDAMRSPRLNAIQSRTTKPSSRHRSPNRSQSRRTTRPTPDKGRQKRCLPAAPAFQS